MAVTYTGVVTVTGEGRDGGRAEAVDGLLEITHSDDGEFGLSAVLDLALGGVDQDTATELGTAAHQICPYSKATRGNIPVVVNATSVAA
ncbi:osmotically inducible protein OsmC [Streptomyces laurentii]|uniref:osmotically inducible protein OsmC n=1 Tax=Streptomyces laurentii TaxID=39478 RepID=UPI0036938FA9